MTMSQKIFDTVSDHLMKQGLPSFDSKLKRGDDDATACAYRGTGGLACAAGALISDEDYLPKMEKLPATAPSVLSPIEKTLGGKLDLADRNLLIALQNRHDRMENETRLGQDNNPRRFSKRKVRDWLRHNLSSIAMQKGLSTKALEAAFEKYQR